MYHLFQPRVIVKSLFDINLEELQARKIKGIIFDLDNTIICWDSPSMEPEISEWLRGILQKNYKICLLSNNMTRRVHTIAAAFDVPYVPKAYKPTKTGYRLALAKMQLRPSEVAVVGDQLFTDILGGNRMGLYTIWVSPLSTKEFLGTKITRKLERLTVRVLRAKGLFPN